MFRCGLKLWSTNAAYIPGAADLLRRDVFQFVELFAVPGTYGGIGPWAALKKETGAEFVVHAAHFMAGMNLADPAGRPRNRELAEEALRFADALGAAKVIFHPGVNGRDEEAAAQLAGIKDARKLVENKPYAGLKPGLVCNGHSPEGIKLIMSGSGAGFCLDVGHALAAAVSLRRERGAWLGEFLALGPAMFHLADGRSDSEMDGHLHLGEGDYDLASVLRRFPPGAMVTLETNKKFKDRLDDCEADVRYLARVAAEGNHA